MAPGSPLAERAQATTRAGLLAALDRRLTADAYDKPAYEDGIAWSRHAEERRDLLDAKAKLEAAPVVGRAREAAAVMDGVVAPGARPGEVQVAQVGRPGDPEDDPLDGVFGPGKALPDPSPDTPAEALDTRTRSGLPPGTPPVGPAAMPDDPAKAGHIFSDRRGHVPNTPENQARLRNLASDPSKHIGRDANGTDWYADDLPDGRQAWAQWRGDRVVNGGINELDNRRTFDPRSGLSRPDRPKQGGK